MSNTWLIMGWAPLPLLWSSDHRPYRLRVETPPVLVEVTGFGQSGDGKVTPTGKAQAVGLSTPKSGRSI